MGVGEWGEAHEWLVAEADPALESVRTDFGQVWVEVSAAMAIADPPKSRRRTIVAGLAVTALVGAGGAAAGGVLSSHTGTYDRDQEDRVLGGPGERLDPYGDDFRQVIAHETDDIPFPSESARQISLDFQVNDQRRHSGRGTRVSTSAMAGFVANDAICSWANSWALATLDGDTRARSEATKELDTASTWVAVATLQDLDNDRFDWLAGVQQAAHGASVPAIGHALAGNVFCVLELVPSLPEAIPAGYPPCLQSVNPCRPPQGDPASGAQ